MYFRVQDRLGRIDTKGGSPTAFFQRLPYELGNELISFTMRDHYVEVTTTKGKTLVLISLGDALEELGDYAGTQVHRSHWVAASASRGLERNDGKLFVKLSDGRRLPVSRTYAASARALPSTHV
nr:LytTR family DNA-binding domain-containing protein [Falsiruegeria litorea]